MRSVLPLLGPLRFDNGASKWNSRGPLAGVSGDAQGRLWPLVTGLVYLGRCRCSGACFEPLIPTPAQWWKQMAQPEPQPGRLRRLLQGWPIGICAATALLLSQVPGFDVLDYHACLALAPIMALCAGLLELRTRDEEVSTGRSAGPRRWWRASAVILTPAIILALNALRVPNCSPLSGLEIYLLGPVASVAIALVMASVAHRLAAGWSRAAFMGLAAASCVPALWHFMTEPQVSAYAPLVGHVAGALYEDVIDIGWCWLSYRLLDLALWLALLAALNAGQGTRRRVALGLALTALAVGVVRAPIDGWRVDAESVRRELPVRAELNVPTGAPLIGAAVAGGRPAPRPAMVLHMPRGRQLAGLRREVTRDALHDYVRLWHFFGRPAGQTIHVHLYPDVATKARLIGARHVEMAKPWLAQVHMVLPQPGATVLRHELAHVFAAPAGRWPFAIPLRNGWLPDALLIEGVAVAAEWPSRGGLDPHRQAKAMRQLGLAPPLSVLLSPAGFFSQSSARAYTLAGSFVRWLVDVEGAAVIDRLYGDGDVAAAVGTTVESLAKRWGEFIDRDQGNRLSERDLLMAQARFETSGPFHRPCPLTLGRCRASAQAAFVAGNATQGRALQERLMRDLAPLLGTRPLGPDLAIALAGARARAGDPQAALRAIQAVLDGPAGPDLSRLRRAALVRARGDLRLRLADRSGARTDWRHVLEQPVADHVKRAMLVRLHLVDSSVGRLWLNESMLLGRSFGRWPARIDALQARLGEDPVVNYLHARAHFFDLLDEPAVERLTDLLPVLQRQWPLIAEGARRLLALRAARRGHCALMTELLGKASEADSGWWRADLQMTCRLAAAAPDGATTGPAID